MKNILTLIILSILGLIACENASELNSIGEQSTSEKQINSDSTSVEDELKEVGEILSTIK